MIFNSTLYQVSLDNQIPINIALNAELKVNDMIIQATVNDTTFGTITTIENNGTIQWRRDITVQEYKNQVMSHQVYKWQLGQRETVLGFNLVLYELQLFSKRKVSVAMQVPIGVGDSITLNEKGSITRGRVESISKLADLEWVKRL